jgi:hypothetical protein
MLVLHDFTVNIQDPVVEAPLGYDFVNGDTLSHKFSITLWNSGGELDLSAATADIIVNRPDGEPITVVADVTDNVVSGTLTADAFTVSGRIYIFATVTVGTATLTVLHKYATVKGEAA